jgi:hypothetical protein
MSISAVGAADRVNTASTTQQPAVRVDRTSAVLQDLQGGLAVPEMDNALQDVRVCSAGNFPEEISTDDFAPLADGRGSRAASAAT